MKIVKKIFSFMIAALLLCAITACSSKKKALPSDYVGRYYNSVVGDEIYVNSDKASISQAYLDKVVINGKTYYDVICMSTTDFYYDYYSNGKFEANVNLNWYCSEDNGKNNVKMNGEIGKYSSNNKIYMVFYGYTLDFQRKN